MFDLCRPAPCAAGTGGGAVCQRVRHRPVVSDAADVAHGRLRLAAAPALRQERLHGQWTARPAAAAPPWLKGGPPITGLPRSVNSQLHVWCDFSVRQTAAPGPIRRYELELLIIRAGETGRDPRPQKFHLLEGTEGDQYFFLMDLLTDNVLFFRQLAIFTYTLCLVGSFGAWALLRKGSQGLVLPTRNSFLRAC